MENLQRVLWHQAPALDGDENFVAITVGGVAYAVALTEVHGLFADRKVVPLPGGSPEYIGLACLRGGIVAVYSLRALLGHPASDTPLRWLILAGEGQSFALAFDDFELYARASHPESSVAERGGHVRGSVVIAGAPRPVICLRAIADCIAVLP